MIIKLSDIKSGFQNRFFDILVDSIPDRGTVFKDNSIRCLVSANILKKNSFKLDGKLDTTIEYKCVRCLDLFYSKISLPINISLGNKSEKNKKFENSDIMDLSTSMDELDLGTIIADLIELDKPMKPLCTDECMGLCAICGINRNSRSCDCKTEQDFEVWKKLKNLVNKEN